MTSPDERYQLPENTAQDIRSMYIWLGGFFGALLLLGILIILFSQSLVKLIPFSAEERFVQPYERLFFDEQTELSEDSQIIQSYLQGLVKDLQSSSDLTDSLTFKVHYSEKPVENAFATLGGHMVIYRGLLDTLENENALAMILAHEMAHIEHRDPAAGMGRALAISMMVAAVSGGYADGVADVLSEAGINQFSRKQEQAADILALDMIQARYGHVGGYDEFFKKVLGTQADIPRWLSSHPNLEDRIAYLNKINTDKNYLVGDTILFPETVRSALAKKQFKTF